MVEAGKQLATTAIEPVRLVVFVTFHFRPARLRYLYDTLRNLSELQIERLTIFVVTNSNKPEELGSIETICTLSLCGIATFSIVHAAAPLNNPFDLTWEHKTLLAESFGQENPSYTHFLYTEDDIAFSSRNLAYYIKYNDSLAKHRLIPAFVRVEYNYDHNNLFFSDIVRPVRIDQRPCVVFDGVKFINSDFPYMAMFLMDRSQMTEYLASRSFSREGSQEVSSWWIAERSAMGLTWEAVPEGYTSRYVIPISLADRRPAPYCYVHHLPYNYTNPSGDKSNVPLGKLCLDDGFY